MDSRIYDLDFPDGRIEKFAVNFFAENLFNRSDSDRWDMGLINEVTNIQKYPSIAIAKEDGTFITALGQYRYVVINKGWDVQIRWKDQSTSWLLMAEVKAGNHIELAE